MLPGLGRTGEKTISLKKKKTIEAAHVPLIRSFGVAMDQVPAVSWTTIPVMPTSEGLDEDWTDGSFQLHQFAEVRKVTDWRAYIRDNPPC